MANDQWDWFFASNSNAEHFEAAKSREDAIAQGRERFGGSAFFICEGRRASLNDRIFSAEKVMEHFEECNEEAWGEDGPERNVSSEAESELEEVLNAAFAAWLQKHRPWLAYQLMEFRSQEAILPLQMLTQDEAYRA